MSTTSLAIENQDREDERRLIKVNAAQVHEFEPDIAGLEPHRCKRLDCGQRSTDSVHAAKPSQLSTTELERHSVECRLTAEEKMLFASILTVIDDGDGCAAGAEYGHKPWLLDHENEELANAQRLDFADMVIDTWRKFKLQDLDGSIRERR